jgi:hypothetical protein
MSFLNRLDARLEICGSGNDVSENKLEQSHDLPSQGR